MSDMKRRAFLGSLLGSAVVATVPVVGSRQRHAAFGEHRGQPSPISRPRLSVTIDDPTLDVGSLMSAREVNERLLTALGDSGLQAALFVCGRRVDSSAGRELVGAWDEAGHLIGHHSYSHLHYHRTSFERFAADFERNLPVVRPYRHARPLFRYPFLKQGDTVEKRDRFRALLAQHGYRGGDVTIDASDWYVDDRMLRRLAHDDGAGLEPYRDYLIAHLLDRAAYYRQLALDVLGHDIAHTLILHHRIINALFLPDVVIAFEKAGWEWIDASQAFDDPIFERVPQSVPAGESLVWAMAKEAGGFDGGLRYPGEDGATKRLPWTPSDSEIRRAQSLDGPGYGGL